MSDSKEKDLKINLKSKKEIIKRIKKVIRR